MDMSETGRWLDSQMMNYDVSAIDKQRVRCYWCGRVFLLDVSRPAHIDRPTTVNVTVCCECGCSFVAQVVFIPREG